VVKLLRIKPDGAGGATWQTEPLCGTGIGRFQVYKTDNANARAIGRQPRWTIHDLYKPIGTVRVRFDTLAEVREHIAAVLAKGG
jgi:hypothetical protein